MLSRFRMAFPVLVGFGLTAVPVSPAYPQPPEAANPADGGGALETTKDDLVLPEEPKTPDELMDAAVLTLKLARPGLAKRYLETIVKMEPDDETLFKLRDRFGTALFLQLSRNAELKPASAELLAMLTRAGERMAKDPARVEALIQKLSGTARDRELAILELQHLGASAVGPIVRTMSDPQAAKDLGQLAYVLTRLGPAANPPVVAMLGAPGDNQQTLAASVLGTLGDKNDELALLEAGFSPVRSESVQLAARRSLANILYRDPLRTDRLSSVGLADRLRTAAADVLTGRTAIPLNDAGQASIWTWNATAGVPQENLVSPRSAALFRAEQLSRQALGVSPGNPDIQAQLLSILQLRDVQATGWDKAVPEGTGTAHDLLLTSGPEMSLRVLSLGREQRNVAAAAGALRALAQIGTRNMLRPVGNTKPAVVAALDDTDPRVQFAAATTILSWEPIEPFSGSKRVVEILARELNSSGAPNMVVVDPNYARGDEVRSLMTGLGFEAATVRTGAEGFTAAANQGDMAVVLLHLNTIRPDLSPTIANFRADSRTASIPIVIYGPAEMRGAATRLIGEYSRVSYLQEASDTGELNRQIRPVLDELNPTPLTPEQHAERARAAAYWLRHIAVSQRTNVFNLEPAEEALAGAIGNPVLAGDAVSALAVIPRPSAQRFLNEAIKTETNPIEIRQAAARNLAFHIQQFGLALSNDEVSNLYSMYSAEQDGGLRSALASVIGSLKPEAKTVEARILSFPIATQPLP